MSAAPQLLSGALFGGSQTAKNLTAFTSVPRNIQAARSETAAKNRQAANAETKKRRQGSAITSPFGSGSALGA